MFKEKNTGGESQGEFWLEAGKLPKAVAGKFYQKLEKTLEGIGFHEGVRELCRESYAEESCGGRPGIDPAVYFKMLMVGFFRESAE